MAPRTKTLLSGVALFVMAYITYRMVLIVDKEQTHSVGLIDGQLSVDKYGKTGEQDDGKTRSVPSLAQYQGGAAAHIDVRKSTSPLKLVDANKVDDAGHPRTVPWVPPVVPTDIQSADQTDPRLIQHIKDHWVLPPFSGPRNLANPKKLHFSQNRQSEFIDNLLKEKTRGFYIECGAATGEYLSNSLFFEKSRDWSGILIEANPQYFKEILELKRHAFMMNACLSPDRKPEVLDFRTAGLIGGLIEHMEPGHKARVVRETGDKPPEKIQCFPLYSILKAMNITHVDYFSLDIEGAEYEILKDFPFDEIKVDVLTIEYVVSGGGTASREKLKKITDLMIDRYGYQRTEYKGFEDIMLSKGV